MFKKGDKVVQVQPTPIAGTVAGFAVDEQTGVVQVRIEWADEAVIHSRHFQATELQAAPVTAPGA